MLPGRTRQGKELKLRRTKADPGAGAEMSTKHGKGEHAGMVSFHFSQRQFIPRWSNALGSLDSSAGFCLCLQLTGMLSVKQTQPSQKELRFMNIGVMIIAIPLQRVCSRMFYSYRYQPVHYCLRILWNYGIRSQLAWTIIISCWLIKSLPVGPWYPRMPRVSIARRWCCTPRHVLPIWSRDNSKNSEP